MISCDQCREKLGGALAHGERARSSEMATHLRDCAGCREFYEGQVRLFAAMDAGLRTMVNEAVPASLLAGGRAKGEQAQTLGNWRSVSWVVPAAAAVLVARSLAIRQRRERLGTAGADVPVVAVGPAVTERSATAQEKQEPVMATKLRAAVVNIPARTDVVPEVIVLAEEQEAYKRYVGGSATGLGNPAAPVEKIMEPIEIVSQEIAQLEIRKLELGSLDEEAQE